jgi:hypothetical protein
MKQWILASKEPALAYHRDMRILTTLHFTAAPEDVAAMLVNPSFAEHVAQEIKATKVTTQDLDKGMTAVFQVGSPQGAAKILGPTMKLSETVTWQKPHADGSRLGHMSFSIEGIPASAQGPLRLDVIEEGTEMVFDADFTVRVPLVGKRIEQMAHESLTAIITACEQVGNRWLETNSRP